MEKNCEKIHYIADNIWFCGAGTAADTEHTAALISSKLVLHCLATGKKEPRIKTAQALLSDMLWRHQGQIGAHLVLGGYDPIDGPCLFNIYNHGSISQLPFATMGSGSLAAMAVFENGWKENLTKEEGVELVKEAITAGITNDLGSGGNVDVLIISKGKQEMLRNVDTSHFDRKFRKPGGYTFEKGTTVVLSSKTTEFDVPMDLSD